jgi:hypothetical protein
MPRKKSGKPRPPLKIEDHVPLPGQMTLPLESGHEIMLPGCDRLNLPPTPRPANFRPYDVVP